MITEHCPWEYRGTECGYTGNKCFTVDDEQLTGGTLAERKALDKCGHKYSSCQLRFPKGENDEIDLPFGGFINARIQI